MHSSKPQPLIHIQKLNRSSQTIQPHSKTTSSHPVHPSTTATTFLHFESDTRTRLERTRTYYVLGWLAVCCVAWICNDPSTFQSPRSGYDTAAEDEVVNSFARTNLRHTRDVLITQMWAIWYRMCESTCESLCESRSRGYSRAEVARRSKRLVDGRFHIRGSCFYDRICIWLKFN